MIREAWDEHTWQEVIWRSGVKLTLNLQCWLKLHDAAAGSKKQSNECMWKHFRNPTDKPVPVGADKNPALSPDPVM